jgi:hypothetical protein
MGHPFDGFLLLIEPFDTHLSPLIAWRPAFTMSITVSPLFTQQKTVRRSATTSPDGGKRFYLFEPQVDHDLFWRVNQVA